VKPIISRLIMPSASLSEAARFAARAVLPSRPTSSPAKAANRTEDSNPELAKTRATSSIPATPLASSSAPGVPGTAS
jgi:hypothetical protein